MRDYYSENLGDGWFKHFDYGLITFSRYGEEYVPCKECGSLFPEAFADNQDDLCGECWNQKHSCSWCGEEHLEDPNQSKDGPLCDKCYTDHLETENRSLKLSLKLVYDFIGKEAAALEGALAEYLANPSDPHRAGLMMGRTQSEVDTMKIYAERKAV